MRIETIKVKAADGDGYSIINKDDQQPHHKLYVDKTDKQTPLSEKAALKKLNSKG